MNSEDKNDLVIDRTKWLIFRPRSYLDEIIEFFNNINKFDIGKDLHLENIFSKKSKIPQIINYKIFDLNDNQKIIQLESTDQNQIETIGGEFYYQFKLNMNLILTENLWLIDNKFLNLLESTKSFPHYEKANIKWSKINTCIYRGKRAEIRNFKYLIENSFNYGKIYFISATNPRSEIYGKRIEYYGDIEQPSSSNFLSPFLNVDKISLRTFLPNKNKLEWTIFKDGTIRTKNTNMIGIKKLIEFILDFDLKNMFFFQKDLFDYMR